VLRLLNRSIVINAASHQSPAEVTDDWRFAFMGSNVQNIAIVANIEVV
jgi:hypothetical protein